MVWRRGEHGADRGAAAVEFALVLPLLVMLLCGIADFSRAFNIQVTLSDAAAEGARLLAIGETVADSRSTVTSLMAPVAVHYPNTAACPPNATGSQASMTVTTTNFQFITPLIGSMFSGVTISGKAARQCAS
jgi:Flp pilus assembly protein TadG